MHDTVITVTSGRTAQQFSTSGPCQVRIKYDGPIYPIYLYAPGVNVISGTATASDLTNTNPKYITAMLTSSGLWNIVINHGLTTATVLTPFSIIVETSRGTNECTNFCSNIPFSFGVVPGVSSTCNCDTNFVWIASNQTCGINCTLFANTTGVRVTGYSDRCVCSDSRFYWNTTQLTCIINCSLIVYTNGNNGTDACFCNTDYIWDISTAQCVRNCSAIQYSSSYSATNVS